MKVQLNDIRAKSTWGGKEPMNHSPSFDYCRKVLAEGANPDESLEVYRGEQLAYTVSSIGWGATKSIKEDKYHSPHIVKYVDKKMSEETKAILALKRAQKRLTADRTAI